MASLTKELFTFNEVIIASVPHLKSFVSFTENVFLIKSILFQLELNKQMLFAKNLLKSKANLSTDFHTEL